MIRCESWQKWTLVVGSIAAVTAFDLSPAGYVVNLRSLYVLSVALACWTLRPGHAVVVTAAVIAALFIKAELSYGMRDFLPLIGTTIARTLAYATVAAFVLSFRRLYDRTLASARQDQMTGVLNKSTFEQEAAFLLSKGQVSGTTMLVAVLDLDGFKQLNDAHGHAAGDAVLKNFSLNLAGEIRRSDRIGRIGGDEFGLVLEAGTEKEARQLARDLHARVSDALAATGQAVTFSMGALVVPPEAPRAVEPLMDEADQLHYRAKRQGKNTVVMAAAGTSGRSATPSANVGETAGAAASV